MFLVDEFEITALKRSLSTTKNEEKKKQVEQLLRYLEKNSDEIRDLAVDYIIVGSKSIYVIERKRISDLINTLYGRNHKTRTRFYDQLRRVREVSEELSNEYNIPSYPILLLEGNIFKHYRTKKGRITPNQWFGLWSSVLENGVYIIRTWNHKETMLLLDILRKRSGKDKQISGLNINKRLRTEQEEMMHILMAISGVGEKTAKQLLSHFGTIKNVINASKEELVKVVGTKLGNHIYNIVNKHYYGNTLEEYVKSKN